MKTVFEHIENIKEKPHHLRKQIAFGVAGGASALIGLVWLVGNLSFGTFAISGSSFADSVASLTATTPISEDDSKNFAGVAAAFPNANAPAHIEIVNTSATSSSQEKRAEQTIIPF